MSEPCFCCGVMPPARCLLGCSSRASEYRTSNPLLDPNICGDDGPITPEQCAQWLDAKYLRHGELEDRAAAMWLRKLSFHVGRATPETAAPPMMSADGGKDIPL